MSGNFSTGSSQRMNGSRRSLIVAVLILAALTGLGAVGSGFAGAITFCLLFILVTGLWHIVIGRSWMSQLVPMGRGLGVMAVAASLVGIPVAVSLDPASAPSTAIAPADTSPATSASTSVSPSTTAPVISASATSTPTTPTPPPTTPTPATSAAATSTPPAATETSGDAAVALATIPVKGRAPKTGYDRDQFGQRWADIDRNGCDQRNDILRRDLTDITTKPGTRDCVITSGILLDPYTGTTINFVRGQDTSNEVHIDHVVALSDAWQKGAQQLSTEQRRHLGNDPLNLLASQGRANMEKGDGDAATWLPQNKSYRCAYVARQVAVKAKYGLWMTQAEHDTIANILASCPGEPLPDGADIAMVATTPAPDTPTTPAPAPVKETAAPPPAPVTTTAAVPPVEVSYKNCTAVRDAGKAPIHAGEPGYGKHLDRDGDGIGCE